MNNWIIYKKKELTLYKKVFNISLIKTIKHRCSEMATLTNTKTVADITIIICFTLFLILLIVGIAISSVFAIAFSFIIGGIGYTIVDYESTKKHYEALQNKYKD